MPLSLRRKNGSRADSCALFVIRGRGARSRPQFSDWIRIAFLCQCGCSPMYSTIVSGSFSRSTTEPSSAIWNTGLAPCMLVNPQSPNADAKAVPAFLVFGDGFRRDDSVIPQPLSPCASETDQLDTRPRSHFMVAASSYVSSTSFGSRMPERLVLITTFCPVKGFTLSTSEHSCLINSFIRGWSISSLVSAPVTFFSSSSVCFATSVVFSWALPAVSLAILESVSASPATAPALSALPSARADLSNADCALISAAPAFSLREPISIPEILLVLTRHISSSARADMSRSVERFARRSFRSWSPRVQQSVNSAMYSPVQPKATSAQAVYSAHSQCSNDVARDETSGAGRIILAHQKRERPVSNGTTS
jgi:hypothetical protein